MGYLEDRAGLAGRAAAIIGGGGGLGRGISLALAKAGVDVAILDRDEASASATASEMAGIGVTGLVRIGDARDPQVLEDFYSAQKERFGRLDIAVNVVGGTFNKPFLETSAKGWDAVLRTNLVYVLHSSQIAARRMRDAGSGGSIINITTIEAHRANPNQAVYAAAKAAVASFSRTLALELGPDRIRVNCVAPDMVPTEAMIASGWMDPEAPTARLGARIAIPLGRFGRSEDVSDSVLFLSSDLSSYMTGATLFPDGGVNASQGWFNWPDGYRQQVPDNVLTSLLDKS